MDHELKKFLSSCSEMNFGVVKRGEGQNTLFRKFHAEITSLCNSLPESVRGDALFFLMKYLGMRFDGEFNFFGNYFTPSWSIVYWLIQSRANDRVLSRDDILNATTAHAMALLLHPLDDHLNDGQLPVSHLSLLIRSQAWMIMNTALDQLARGVDGGREIVRGFMDDYYSSIDHSEEVETLDNYIDLFRKQMATLLTVPALMTRKVAASEKAARDIQTALESFGVAWRLLDDVKDLETDMMKGDHSAIYTCLPEEMRLRWNMDAADKRGARADAILDHILKNGVVIKIKKRMRAELRTAARIAEDRKMRGLAEEFRSLALPLENP
ncbi:MAG: class 1 isoprenoid biosynthesis enzyme [Desulfobacterales bacterium]|nr:class 1 isoprenoid biosynthesis enzyme [Desulfobacterales bacterium]